MKEYLPTIIRVKGDELELYEQKATYEYVIQGGPSCKLLISVHILQYPATRIKKLGVANTGNPALTRNQRNYRNSIWYPFSYTKHRKLANDSHISKIE